MSDLTARLSTAIADRYRIERHLGQGGMATVYLAHDVKHDRKVALKVLRPELAAVIGAERFLQEIRVTANLQHPHILPLHDSGEADTFLYYVMPYVEGETLRDKLNREKQLGIEQAVEITRSVAGALDYAHRQGVIHRDIKPENILLHDGQPLIADFGIALAVSAAGGARLTETGLSLGTPHYMSPEQAMGDRELDARSDVYSLGAMLYEMLAGDPPYTGSTAQAIVAKVITEKPPAVTLHRDTVPPHVAAAVHRALAKLPADRFTSTAEFAAALVNPGFTLATAAATPAAGGGWGSWNRLTVGFAAATLLLTVALGWVLTRPRPVAAVTRLSLALPATEGLASVRGNRLALSADGSRLVYVGPGEGGSRLWVRPRDQLHATPLPGTEQAVHPMMSPDGGRVAFLTLESPIRLKVISLSGGPPTTLADSAVGLDGAAWGADGFLYYDGITAGGDAGLMRVAAGGGRLEQVTTVDTAAGETDHVWPEVLPEGRGVLFTVVRGGNLADADIAVSVPGSGTHQVVARGIAAKYAAPGYLLTVSADGSLLAAPFDLRRLERTAEPVAVAEGVGVRAFGSADLALSASGTLLYTSGGRATDPFEIVWVSLDGTAEPVDPGWVGDFGSLALSPDGRRLAVSVVQGSEEQIWVKQLPRGPLTKLTFEGSQNWRPSWTPDGRSLLFVSNRGASSDLFMKRADGSDVDQVVLDRDLPVWEAFRSRGGWLVYRTLPRDIAAVSPQGDSVSLVATPFSEVRPQLSSDERWLAYQSDESGRAEVYVRPFPASSTAKWQVSTNGGAFPVWSPDGRQIYYWSTTTSELLAVAVVPGSVFTMGERRALFATGSYVQGLGTYDVAPDGRRFVMMRARYGDQSTELVMVQQFFTELQSRVGR